MPKPAADQREPFPSLPLSARITRYSSATHSPSSACSPHPSTWARCSSTSSNSATPAKIQKIHIRHARPDSVPVCFLGVVMALPSALVAVW